MVVRDIENPSSCSARWIAEFDAGDWSAFIRAICVSGSNCLWIVPIGHGPLTVFANCERVLSRSFFDLSELVMCSPVFLL